MQNESLFFKELDSAIKSNAFIHLTLSKTYDKTLDLKKIRVKVEDSEIESRFFFTYNFSKKNEVKSFSLSAGIEEIKFLLNGTFKVATLFTKNADFGLQINKNGEATFHNRPPSLSNTFDKKSSQYLIELGVLNEEGRVSKGKGDKFKQINKFVEIMASILANHALVKQESPLQIVDMGAGKGYLSFALYDYLTNSLKKESSVKGVEIRKDLIEFCNQIATKVNFKNLSFEQGYITNYFLPKVDVLIALHACDTATDDAIFKGIQAKASLIICAPCCHKQIRKQMECQTHLQSILQYGIMKERMAEMVTDTIRALLLEAHGYSSKVFEFISADHTGKNVMIVAQKNENPSFSKLHLSKIEKLKEEFGIKFHYLESLLNRKE